MSKVIGLDLGSRTLGIAMSDVSRWYAYGVENFRFEEGNYKKAVEHDFFMPHPAAPEGGFGFPLI